MSYPGLDKTLEKISRFNELSSRVYSASNEVASKLPGLLADTSRAYESLANLDWEALQAKALEDAQLKNIDVSRSAEALIEDYAALIKKKPQDVIWAGLVAAQGDGVLEDKTVSCGCSSCIGSRLPLKRMRPVFWRLLEQVDFLSYQDSKDILNCSQQDENDTQASVYIPESKRHSLFAQVAKAYAAWLGLKLVFVKGFSKVLELVKEKLATLNSSFVDALRANENAPPDFMLSYSLTDNAPPKNNGKPFSALLFLSRVSNSRKELIA